MKYSHQWSCYLLHNHITIFNITFVRFFVFVLFSSGRRTQFYIVGFFFVACSLRFSMLMAVFAFLTSFFFFAALCLSKLVLRSIRCHVHKHCQRHWQHTSAIPARIWYSLFFNYINTIMRYSCHFIGKKLFKFKLIVNYMAYKRDRARTIKLLARCWLIYRWLFATYCSAQWWHNNVWLNCFTHRFNGCSDIRSIREMNNIGIDWFLFVVSVVQRNSRGKWKCGDKMIIVYCPRTHTHMQTRGVEVFAERMCRKNNTEDHNMFWRECVCVLYGTNESKSESILCKSIFVG